MPLSWNLERKRANELDTTSANVDAVLDHIFTDTATQAVVISKRGYVIGERYADGYDNNSLGTSWSVAKSFYSALMGIAVEEGWIQSTQQRASEFLTEWSDSDKADITIAQILSMRSGYDGNDQVFFQNDQTAYAINLPLTALPGIRFAYSNANSQLMEPLLRRATGVSAHDYLQSKLLQPLGIENAGLWLDATAQQPMTYCCIDLKPDDFLKFGLLYARDGRMGWHTNCACLLCAKEFRRAFPFVRLPMVVAKRRLFRFPGADYCLRGFGSTWTKNLCMACC